ncbi:MAG: parallel beta-helix repeat protein [Candidatus Paceibacteria bacterium]|jgi:parallel beta-helix repeat protein
MRLRWRYTFIIIILAIALLVASFSLPGYIDPSGQNSAIERQFARVYNSLIKVTDLVFLPFGLLGGEYLPFVVIQETNGKGEVLVKWGEYQSTSKLKHSIDDTIVVSLPSDQPFNGAGSFIFSPLTNENYRLVFDTYRADNLNYLSPGARLVNLKLNGSASRVFVAIQVWDKSKLDGLRLPDDSSVFSMSFVPDGLIESEVLFGEAQDGMLQTLENILYKTSDEDFVRTIGSILDIDSLYRCVIIQASSERLTSSQTTMLYNTATGRFQYVSIDSNCSTDTLSQRVFSIDKFRDSRDKLAKGFTDNQKRIDDERSTFSEIQGLSTRSILKDFSKNTTGGAILRTKESVLDSISQDLVFSDNSYESSSDVSLYDLPILFDRIDEIFYDKEAFLSTNLQFASGKNNTIILQPGRSVFRETAIIPLGLKLVVQAGANALLDSGVSIISYSPITILGTEDFPVNFAGLRSATWGTVAVINTPEDSLLQYARFSGGSGDVVNGVTYTGMVAFHNANVDVASSTFSNAGDDDALNIKFGRASVTTSVFSDNFSDAIDIDFAKDNTVIKNNDLLENGYGGGGDGIDLSWSSIEISDNNILGCTDKGISVGESSNPRITSNTIQGCDIGIAVKDRSDSVIEDNVFIDDRVGISVYVKKPVFGPSVARVFRSEFSDVLIEYENDGKSVMLINE